MEKIKQAAAERGKKLGLTYAGATFDDVTLWEE